HSLETRGFALSDNASGRKALRLDGKVAAITGGGSGIGQAIALRFAAHGAVVRVLDVNESAAAATCQRIVAEGGIASFHLCDVTNQSDVRATFDDLFDLGHVHILVNNAGISHIGTVESTTEADFDRVLRVNVKGYFNCINAVIGKMKSAGGGVILNMASVAGSAGLADRFAYSTSKGAVIAMTYSVARDYIAHNIRCNSISPARVHTAFVDGYLRQHYPGREEEMFGKLPHSQPTGRLVEPDEVGSLA